MATPLRHTKLVLVEGKDEVNFFEAVLAHLTLVDIEVRSFDGADNLSGFLKALRSVEGFSDLVSLGIARDAEGNGAGAFQSVRNSLQSAGLGAPNVALEWAGVRPRVAVLINPHGMVNGRFDDVCSESVADTPIMQCVRQYIECLKGLDLGLPQKEWKTRVHAFIAAQVRPEVSLGVAAKCGYFPLGHPTFQPVRRLFEMIENP